VIFAEISFESFAGKTIVKSGITTGNDSRSAHDEISITRVIAKKTRFKLNPFRVRGICLSIIYSNLTPSGLG
jgi:hypothetical protein